MNPRTRFLFAAIAVLLTAASVWFLGRSHKAATPAKAPAPATAAAKPASPMAVVPPAPASAPAPKPLAPQQVAEVEATARMYLAHAPLRVPEVTDPDSVTNRQILQTMVGKALGNLPPPPPKARSTP